LEEVRPGFTQASRECTSPDRTDPGPSPASDRTGTAKDRVVVQFRPVETGMIPV